MAWLIEIFEEIIVEYIHAKWNTYSNIYMTVYLSKGERGVENALSNNLHMYTKEKICKFDTLY